MKVEIIWSSPNDVGYWNEMCKRREERWRRGRLKFWSGRCNTFEVDEITLELENVPVAKKMRNEQIADKKRKEDVTRLKWIKTRLDASGKMCPRQTSMCWETVGTLPSIEKKWRTSVWNFPGNSITKYETTPQIWGVVTWRRFDWVALAGIIDVHVAISFPSRFKISNHRDSETAS